MAPALGEFPKQKPAAEFNNWPAAAPYALQYCPAARNPGAQLHVPGAAQLSAQELSYHYFHCFITFLGIQISVTAPDALGEKWWLPPPPPST